MIQPTVWVLRAAILLTDYASCHSTTAAGLNSRSTSPFTTGSAKPAATTHKVIIIDPNEDYETEVYDHTCYIPTQSEKERAPLSASDQQICELAGKTYLPTPSAEFPGCSDCKCCQQKDCIPANIALYNGTWSRTKSGKKCKRWLDTSYNYNGASEAFVRNLSDSYDYCRDFTYTGGTPYCFILSSTWKWEHCSIERCPETTTLIKPTTNGKVGNTTVDTLIKTTRASGAISTNVTGLNSQSTPPVTTDSTQPATTTQAFIIFDPNEDYETEVYDHTCYIPTQSEKERAPLSASDQQICELAGKMYLPTPSAEFPGCSDCKCCQKKDCIPANIAQYNGTWSRTKSGKKCKRWLDTSYYYKGVEEEFLRILSESYDYCRDFTYSGGTPYCFILNSTWRWEDCSIEKCLEPTTTTVAHLADLKLQTTPASGAISTPASGEISTPASGAMRMRFNALALLYVFAMKKSVNLF